MDEQTPNGEVVVEGTEKAGQEGGEGRIMDPPVAEGVALTEQEIIDRGHAEAQSVAAEWLKFKQPPDPVIGALAAAYIQALVLCATCPTVETFRENLKLNVKGLRRMAWQMWIDMNGPTGTGAEGGGE